MIKQFLRYLLYNSILARPLYQLVYYKWNRFYADSRNLLSGDSLKRSLKDDQWRQYHAAEKVSFVTPRFKLKGARVPQQIAFYIDKTFVVSAGEYYQFEEAYLIGENAVAVTAEGKIILDSTMDLPNVLPKCSPRLLVNATRLHIDGTYEDVISLVHIFCNSSYVNYFHWINDSLLLLEGKEAYENHSGKRLKVLVNQNMTGFQKQFLNLLDISEDDLICWDDHNKIKVKNLVVVKSRRTGTNMDEIVSPQGCQWLRNKLYQRLAGQSSKFGKRIFITRQHTSCRRILNYEELVPVLEKYDFEIVNVDELTIAEQVLLFRDMEVLFTVHGAGLTNIIFSEQLKILELIGNVDRKGDFQWYCAYYSMSQALGHQYSFLECESVGVYSQTQMKQFYDVRVEINEVEKVLNDIVNG